jgi:hypothetical protein
MTSINQADGAGELDIGGKVSPVSYHVIARPLDEGAGREVHIEVSLPRDWLVARGFKSEAVLVRQDGSRETVRVEKHVGVDDPISVVLTSAPKSVESEQDLGDHFPELLVH